MNKSSHVLSNEKSKEKFLEVPSKPIHHKSTEKKPEHCNAQSGSDVEEP